MAYLHSNSTLRMPARTSPYASAGGNKNTASPYQSAGARILSLNLGRMTPTTQKTTQAAGSILGPLGSFGQFSPFLALGQNGRTMQSGGGGSTGGDPGGVPTPYQRVNTGNRSQMPLEDGPVDWLGDLGKKVPGAFPTVDVPPASEDEETTKGNRDVDWGGLMALLQGQMNSSMQALRGRALAKKKEILLGFGSRELAQRVLGGGQGAYGNYGAYAPDTSGNGLFAFKYTGGIPFSNPGGSWEVVSTSPDGRVSVVGRGGEKNGQGESFQADGFAGQAQLPGVGSDDPFFNLISDDPDKSTSTMAMINRDYRDRQFNANQDWNANNLWYGGARGYGLNQLNRSKLEDVDASTREVQAQLGNIDDEIAQSQSQWASKLFDMQMQQFMAMGGQ
jgi:hypothetical protein